IRPGIRVRLLHGLPARLGLARNGRKFTDGWKPTCPNHHNFFVLKDSVTIAPVPAARRKLLNRVSYANEGLRLQARASRAEAAREAAPEGRSGSSRHRAARDWSGQFPRQLLARQLDPASRAVVDTTQAALG